MPLNIKHKAKFLLHQHSPINTNKDMVSHFQLMVLTLDTNASEGYILVWMLDQKEEGSK